jgi:hypothetical protein
VKVAKPDVMVTQVRYQTADMELFMFNNASAHHAKILDVTFLPQITANKQGWIWDAVTGDRFKLELKNGQFKTTLYPADSKIIVFNTDRHGENWKPIPEIPTHALKFNPNWKVVFNHINGTVKTKEFSALRDLKEMPELTHFAGTVTYTSTLQLSNTSSLNYIDLGSVFGIAELSVNGKYIGSTWHGRNAFTLGNVLRKGNNSIEIKVTTVMLNYMKSLTENAIVQYWANNSKRKEQPLQSMGMIGPVNLFN